jgi:hypothetical protein
MAELTLEMPDELARQLKPLQDRLPELLAGLVGAIPICEQLEHFMTLLKTKAYAIALRQ